MKLKTNLLLTAFAIIVSLSFFSCDLTNPEVLEASSIELYSGGDQTGIITQHLNNNIVIIAKDQNGDAIINTSIKFVIEKGAFSNGLTETKLTDENGKASVRWTLGPDEGEQSITISAYKADGTTHLENSPLIITATASVPNQVTDIDNNIYGTVKIGAKVWMAENLKTTKYANEDNITLINNTASWASLENNNTDKAYCFYLNDPSSDYGALYTLSAATNGSSPDAYNEQGVCPDGWHLPNDQEWEQLIEDLGGELIAGGKMKEQGTTNWDYPNESATNESGFTALGGGSRTSSGDFVNEERYAYWWSNTASAGTEAKVYSVKYNSSSVQNSMISKSFGISVRCIMNYDVNY